MKRYRSCFLFFLCLTGACLIVLFYMTASLDAPQSKEVQMPETFEEPILAQSEPESPAHIVLNQEKVKNETNLRQQYYLVAEEGYLIVYDSTKESVSLFTHMPLAEFPLGEQERLMEGIWFPTMVEIFSYLESYSS